MNSYNFTGRLVNDPISRQTTKGIVATFRVALDKPARFTVDVDAWGRLAGIATRLTKRRHVAISGYWEQRQYHDSNGQARERHYVVAEHITFLPASADIAEAETSPTPITPTVERPDTDRRVS